MCVCAHVELAMCVCVHIDIDRNRCAEFRVRLKVEIPYKCEGNGMRRCRAPLTHSVPRASHTLTLTQIHTHARTHTHNACRCLVEKCKLMYISAGPDGKQGKGAAVFAMGNGVWDKPYMCVWERQALCVCVWQTSLVPLCETRLISFCDMTRLNFEKTSYSPSLLYPWKVNMTHPSGRVHWYAWHIDRTCALICVTHW